MLAIAAEKDDDFDVSGVRDVMAAAGVVYKIHDAEARLSAYYPKGPHAFPPDARKTAYEFSAAAGRLVMITDDRSNATELRCSR